MKDKEIHMLSQPLTTEEGFLNEACINELAAAINNMPETWERLADEPEWNLRGWVGANEITGLLARWAIQQANGTPPHLDVVTDFCRACLILDERFRKWDDQIGSFAHLTLCEINKLLWDILNDFSRFMEWNEEKFMQPKGLQWIDLSALLHNVCLSVRNERRHDVAFDAAFTLEQARQT